MSEAPDWQDGALCRQVDPELFFPDKGGSVREAKKVCARCDVLPECRLNGLTENLDSSGVWGGLSHKERLSIARLGVPLTTAA